MRNKSGKTDTAPKGPSPLENHRKQVAENMRQNLHRRKSAQRSENYSRPKLSFKLKATSKDELS